MTKKKSNKMRALSMLLTAVMLVFALLPSAVLADGEDAECEEAFHGIGGMCCCVCRCRRWQNRFMFFVKK